MGAELFGSDRMLLESVVGARERGFNCIVVLPERGPLVDALRAAGASVVVSPGLVLRKSLLRPSNWLRSARAALRASSAAWRIISRVQPDCLYVNTITIPLWPIAGRLRRVPTLSHVHEAEASASRALNRALYAPHLLAQRVLTNSAFARATIAAAIPSLAERTRIVHNGVQGPADPTAPRAALDGPMRLLFVGRLSPRKGPDIAVEALRILRERGIDARLDLVGSAFDGYEWFESQLREAVREHGLADRVVFHGFHEQIWGFFADADVLVVPSTLDEPFGNTAVEGVLALRPVVASNTSGLREAAGGYPTTALVAPADPAALAAAIVDLRDRWPEIVGSVSDSLGSALDRHAPAQYRAAVAAEITALARPAAGPSRAPAAAAPASAAGTPSRSRMD